MPYAAVEAVAVQGDEKRQVAAEPLRSVPMRPPSSSAIEFTERS